MNKIEINEMRDVIIVEKSNGDDILRGSKLFCGCCGQVLGEVKKKISFPFDSIKLIGVLKNKSFESTLFGLRHKKCGHTMFSFNKTWTFITLENYMKQVIEN